MSLAARLSGGGLHGDAWIPGIPERGRGFLMKARAASERLILTAPKAPWKRRC